MSTVTSTSGVSVKALSLFLPGQSLFTAADLTAMPTHLPSTCDDIIPGLCLPLAELFKD